MCVLYHLSLSITPFQQFLGLSAMCRQPLSQLLHFSVSTEYNIRLNNFTLLILQTKALLVAEMDVVELFEDFNVVDVVK